MKLTEENITQFGFEFHHKTTCFNAYIREKDKFTISYCTQSHNDDYFVAGHWYHGTELFIDTVEELKMLYKLVTKKELI